MNSWSRRRVNQASSSVLICSTARPVILHSPSWSNTSVASSTGNTWYAGGFTCSHKFICTNWFLISEQNCAFFTCQLVSGNGNQTMVGSSYKDTSGHEWQKENRGDYALVSTTAKTASDCATAIGAEETKQRNRVSGMSTNLLWGDKLHQFLQLLPAALADSHQTLLLQRQVMQTDRHLVARVAAHHQNALLQQEKRFQSGPKLCPPGKKEIASFVQSQTRRPATKHPKIHATNCKQLFPRLYHSVLHTPETFCHQHRTSEFLGSANPYQRHKKYNKWLWLPLPGPS